MAAAAPGAGTTFTNMSTDEIGAPPSVATVRLKD
jgi:hypothetical protein